MSLPFAEVFSTLKSVFRPCLKQLHVIADTDKEYTLVSQIPSPLPQHKGKPMYFGSVRLGKAYVSFHLMPLYMNPKLTKTISPSLKKRMQGKTCFNFKANPDQSTLTELKRLTAEGLEQFKNKKWL